MNFYVKFHCQDIAYIFKTTYTFLTKFLHSKHRLISNILIALRLKFETNTYHKFPNMVSAGHLH